MDVWCGLDLGKYTDFAAVSVLNRFLAIDRATGRPERDSKGPKCYFWAIRGLRRWPLKTAYSAITRDVVRIVRRPDLRPRCRLGRGCHGCRTGSP